MKKEKRAQLNIRLRPEDEQRIEDLRRGRSPIPSATDLVRDLIADAHEREVGKAKRK